jgi:sialic acid synthase SpsE
MNGFGLAEGRGGRVALIAHTGVNHDGSATRAVALAELAAHCGAQALVLPLYHPELFRDGDWGLYQGPLPALGLDRESTAFCELGAGALSHCLAIARQRGLRAGLQVCDTLALDLARELGPDFICLDLQGPGAPGLLDRALACGLPLAVQLGEADTGDLAELQQRAGRHRDRVLVMHGSQLAPVDDACASPERVQLLARYFPMAGYCDHGSSLACTLAAARAGARAISVYITLDRNARGPCHHWALDRAGLSAHRGALDTLNPAIPTGRPSAAAPGRWWEHPDEYTRESGTRRP